MIGIYRKKGKYVCNHNIKYIKEMKFDPSKRLSNQQTRPLQLRLLKILEDIDRVCKAHNIRYYLIAGTMLGAVRHKGFIPWDDDADVAMPRADYDRFIKHANEWLDEKYELVSGEDTPQYPYQFARIQDKGTTYVLRRDFSFVGGLPVDVFPLDGMTDSKLRQRIHYAKYRFLVKMLYFSLVDPYKHGRGLRSLVVRVTNRLISPKWVHRKLDSVQKEYSMDSHPLVADHDNDMSRGILPKEVYGTPVAVSFEGHHFAGVHDADTYLSHCYGDYMKPPKTPPLQNFRYLNLEQPYKRYAGQASPTTSS